MLNTLYDKPTGDGCLCKKCELGEGMKQWVRCVFTVEYV